MRIDIGSQWWRFELTTWSSTTLLAKNMVYVGNKGKSHSNAIAEEGKDLISNLPIDLMYRILDGMLISDAARTSVLSKTWRNIWETYHCFNLNTLFFNRLVYNKDEQVHREKFIAAVNMIFFAHRGPILKLNLYMPPGLRLHESPFLDVWMKQVSDSGIQYLRLNNAMNNPTISVPSQLFSCSGLMRLMLINCKLNPPPNSRGYCNLVVVHLSFVTLARDMSFGPRIKVLSLVNCAGIQHLGNQFKYHSQNLYKLVIVRDQKLENSALDLDFNPFTNKMKSINLYKLLGHIPSPTDLTVNGVCLQFLEPGLALHKKLTTDWGNLKMLKFYELKFNEMHQISNAFCLIRSFPNMQILHLSVKPEANRNPIEWRTEQYLESPDCRDIILDQLKIVEIRDVMGSKAELLFIKLVLAIAPSLRRMTIFPNSNMTESKEEIKIFNQLFCCLKRSPVEIIWRGNSMSMTLRSPGVTDPCSAVMSN
ncbi:hypothetical protein POM88_013923 [Heracleum sosnowskyi]|uniref:F-box domain-containing protein n=1 Tax=Heracleum sosnowskyi TaxID=360622 RepID=A0AAD8IZG4_9APIA|nr:hypothetical protein POM88_013923 [Heracleum sosnowskyi]